MANACVLQLLETGVAAVLDVDLISAGIADARHRRRRKNDDERFGNLGAIRAR